VKDRRYGGITMKTLNIRSPLNEETIKKLKAGDQVLITGVIYTARDAAHKRMVEALDRGEKLPFDIANQTIYYMGPTPAKPGQVIGSAGPTTSGRMDSYAVRLMAAGLRGMVGKGNRSQAVKDAMKKYKAVYFAAIGGAGALISKSIKKAEVIAYEDLGAEAICRLEVENFPATVINDIYGGDLYEQGKAKYQVKV
jgi:fumarate hydratase subunit beta